MLFYDQGDSNTLEIIMIIAGNQLEGRLKLCFLVVLTWLNLKLFLHPNLQFQGRRDVRSSSFLISLTGLLN